MPDTAPTRRSWRRHATYANVMVTVMAVVVAGGGTAAWAKLKVRSANIVNGTIQTKDLHASAVTTPKVKTGAVTGAKLASGSVTAAKLAAVPYVAVSKSSVQPISNNSTTAVTWNVEDEDPAGMHDAGTPTELRANVAGLYVAAGSLTWGNDGNFTGFRMAFLFHNGGIAASDSSKAADAGFFAAGQSLSIPMRMAAGDVVTLRALTIGDATQDVSGTFSLRWVGP